MTSVRGLWLVAGVVSWAILTLTPLATAMTASMVTHVLQLALLAIAGGMLGHGLPSSPLRHFNQYGITGTALALLTLTVWLLPLSLDQALNDSTWALAKFLSLPLLLGLPLARSWAALPLISRALLIANAVPMLFVMGWLYREAPVRLCNNYLVNDQQVLGLAFWLLAGAIVLTGAIRVLAGSGRHSQP